MSGSDLFFIGLIAGFFVGTIGTFIVTDRVMTGWIDRWSSASSRSDRMHRRAQIAEGRLARIANVVREMEEEGLP